MKRFEWFDDDSRMLGLIDGVCKYQISPSPADDGTWSIKRGVRFWRSAKSKKEAISLVEKEVKAKRLLGK